ncbi:MAG TPA: VOC family protein [Rhodanobacteraceae bacterium]|nr:VOC family protein [Rhodanobacteraceae bacterium]
MATDSRANPSPAAGVVIYAKDVDRLGAFYAAVADCTQRRRDADFIVLQAGAFELVLVAVPAQLAARIEIPVPPRRREATPIKPVFFVPDIEVARCRAAEHGGQLDPPDREWRFDDWRVCDGCDPEGNVFQLREAGSGHATDSAR